MSSNLYCNVYKETDKEVDIDKKKEKSLKSFNHLGWQTRDFFREEKDYSEYILSFPSLCLSSCNRYNLLCGRGYSVPFISLSYIELSILIESLCKVKSSIISLYHKQHKSCLVEDYNEVNAIIEQLNFCQLYCKYELENVHVRFDFYIQ